MASFGSLKSAIFEKEERKQQYQAHIRGLNAYDRHKKFLKDYVGFYGKERSTYETFPVKTDKDTLREGYRFIRSEEDDMDPSWEQKLVKRYYDKLFKEYCIADMSHYKSGKIGLRWRTEKEVISGKGQFICGNKHCNEKDGLASYEVNFSYFEAGENKQALVKLVTCERCAEKLHYKKRKEKEQLEKKEKEEYKRKRERSNSDDNTDNEYEGSKERRKKGLMFPVTMLQHYSSILICMMTGFMVIFLAYIIICLYLGIILIIHFGIIFPFAQSRTMVPSGNLSPTLMSLICTAIILALLYGRGFG